jgi:secreted Zn-dependent insulinase-like peptidase
MTIYYLGQSQNSEDFEVSFSFPCGDINEPIEKNGISHICEHLIFRIKINGVELKDYIQKNGFYANAYTYHDATI